MTENTVGQGFESADFQNPDRVTQGLSQRKKQTSFNSITLRIKLIPLQYVSTLRIIQKEARFFVSFGADGREPSVSINLGEWG
jgi:hypothetical protein